ncbi:hypothetical protein [Haloferula sp. A504]|uniref:hypothetical protein n=1 Tax=Haloferula sp. A504 TaxID=3373601 RepID=UPI0031C94ADF|nr:hypothetical protein [Verrucomicrobiaceae bacterium E54]
MVLIAGTTLSAFAQGEGKTSFNDAKTIDGSMIRPNPYDKFIALDDALGENTVDWRGILSTLQVDVNPEDLSDKEVGIPAMLGFRICDGVMAIKARDAEMLRACADDIEALGKIMGVTDGDLRRAKLVRSYADRGLWTRVFLELGFLQQDIENVLKRDFDKSSEKGTVPVGKILYAAGWMQGARYTSTIISQNYNPTTAGLLREPRLVAELNKQLGEVSNRKDADIVKILSTALTELEQLVDVPMGGKISEKNVKRIAEVTSTIVSKCRETAK